jgi:hypothetical protein
MAKSPEGSYYAEPAEFLQQGDIFRVNLVAPAADARQRIFRTKDGRHGSLVFAENLEAKVFDRAELDSVLATAPSADLRPRPFHLTSDGQEEMVVAYATLHRFFIIATQTCDICGRDEPPHLPAAILPVITLENLCRREVLPWLSAKEPTTIHEFVLQNCTGAAVLESAPDMEYVPRLKALLARNLKESSRGKQALQDLGRLKNYLSKYHSKQYMFSLPQDLEFGLPESYVDFSAVFTVHSAQLLEIRESRLVTIADPYRLDFAKRFGEFFARLALPRPMRPDG